MALLVGGNSAPTVAHAAAAATNPVTGTSVALSVLGADANGESHLTYSWTATTVPSGAAAPTYSANRTNAAKNTTATFTAAGSYVFQVTITNEYGLTVTSSVNVTVNQTPSGALAVFPADPTLLPSQTCQMQAFNTDQFGAPIAGSLTAAWSVSPSSGAGTITAGGLYGRGERHDCDGHGHCRQPPPSMPQCKSSSPTIIGSSMTAPARPPSILGAAATTARSSAVLRGPPACSAGRWPLTARRKT